MTVSRIVGQRYHDEPSAHLPRGRRPLLPGYRWHAHRTRAQDEEGHGSRFHSVQRGRESPVDANSLDRYVQCHEFGKYRPAGVCQDWIECTGLIYGRSHRQWCRGLCELPGLHPGLGATDQPRMAEGLWLVHHPVGHLHPGAGSRHLVLDPENAVQSAEYVGSGVAADAESPAATGTRSE